MQKNADWQFFFLWYCKIKINMLILSHCRIKIMAHIIIKNVGPIREVDIELNKINVFMGAQSSGKSTIAKIICHCQWVEKCFFPAIDSERLVCKYSKNFYENLVEHHRLTDYFNDNSSIFYVGDYVTIEYNHNAKRVSIKVNENIRYSYPKITYIPSERNLLAAIPFLTKYKDTDDYILDFMYDWFAAREDLKGLSLTEILNSEIAYSFSNERDYIENQGNRILLTNASSGVQSLTPMMLVLKHNLETIYQKEKTLSFDQRMIVYSLLDELSANPVSARINHLTQLLSDRGERKIPIPKNPIEANSTISHLIETVFNYHLSKIFLEEPEQNLFPNTQIKFVYWLIESLKHGQRDHQLTLTTHSPYVLFSLNNCMMGGIIGKNIPKSNCKKFDSSSAWIYPKTVSIYEITGGTLRCIQDEDGIIEDNYLNKAYKEVSAEYLSLLEYYDDEK